MLATGRINGRNSIPIKNGIDDDAFILLQDENLKELIPNMGRRLKFKKKLDDYLLLSKENINCYTLDVDGSINTSNASTSTLTIETLGCLPIDIEPIPIDIEPNIERDDFLVPEAPIKRQKLEVSLFEKGLLQYLETFPDGKIILRNKNKLNEYFRSKLCKVIIDHLFSKYPSYKIPQFEFVRAAQEIENTFPSENANIYFRPYRPKTDVSPRHQCGGKLWAKYSNLKKIYNYLDKSKTVPSDSSEDDNNIQEEISLHFINNHCSPFDEVISHWDLSFNKRRKLLKELELHEYYSFFPALKLPDGHSLLLRDFERMFTNKNNNLICKWPEVQKAILQLAQEKGVLQEESIFNEVVALLTLPLLFAPTTVRDGKKSWRPSKLEVCKSFIIHINSTSNLHSTIERSRQDAAKKKITLQPFIIFAGDEKNPEGMLSYISIDNNVYLIESCLKAVDVTFKIFFALDARYPPESSHIWTYIQRTSFPSVKLLVKHMKVIHALANQDEYKCAENGCDRFFLSVNSFKKHLNSHENTRKTSLKTDFTSENIDVTPEHSKNHVDTTTQRYFETDRPASDFEVLSNIPESDESSDELERFRELISNRANVLICRLYGQLSMPRKEVQNIIEDFQDCFMIPLHTLKNKISLSEFKSDSEKKNILQMFEELDNIFLNLNSEYRRMNHLENTGYYIKPEQITIGQHLVLNSRGILKPTELSYQFISLKKTLKMLFQMKDVFKICIENIRELQEDKHTVTNLTQAELWKTKIEHTKELIFPLLIYCDDFEVGNPLGAHSGIHKLGAVYYTIPVIPLSHSSQLSRLAGSMNVQIRVRRRTIPVERFTVGRHHVHHLQHHGAPRGLRFFPDFPLADRVYSTPRTVLMRNTRRAILQLRHVSCADRRILRYVSNWKRNGDCFVAASYSARRVFVSGRRGSRERG
ncbi:unnamed protein product [Phaedon cochleariae]|uniref:C2H2-type domain-containing protein n=1 Tax=Phaedon cochleariae TaxID=80249 RepID=A0A9P0GHS0_PHACE|nr:unnamed protein product [Phaedon cochleariae]